MNEHFFPTVTVMLDKFANDLEVEMLYAGRGTVKLTSIFHCSMKIRIP